MLSCSLRTAFLYSLELPKPKQESNFITTLSCDSSGNGQTPFLVFQKKAACIGVGEGLPTEKQERQTTP